MNWNKAYNTLIITFILLNIGLFALNVKMQERYKLSPQREADLIYIMGERYVSIYDYFPSFEPMQRMTIRPFDVNERELVQNIIGKDVTIAMRLVGQNIRRYESQYGSVTFYTSGTMQGIIEFESSEGLNPPDGFTQEAALNSGKQFVSKITGGAYALKSSNVYFDDVNNTYVIEYNEYYKKHPLFSSYVKVVVSQKGVIKAESKRLIPDKLVREKHFIVPIDMILYNLVDAIQEEERIPIRIRKIELGYDFKYTEYNAERQDYVEPYYRITLGDGTEYYINAYTNEIKY